MLLKRLISPNSQLGPLGVKVFALPTVHLAQRVPSGFLLLLMTSLELKIKNFYMFKEIVNPLYLLLALKG